MNNNRASSPGLTQGASLWLTAILIASGCTQAARDQGGAFPSDLGEIDDGTSVDNATAADEDAGTGDAPQDEVPVNVAGCEDDEARAAKVLAERCASCHGNGNKNGGFGEALNPDAIVTRGLVVLGDLPGSVIYRVTVNGVMPRNASNLTQQEQQALADWILCKANATPTAPSADGGVPSPGDGIVNPPADDDDDDDVAVDDDDDLDDDEKDDDDDEKDDDDGKDDD